MHIRNARWLGWILIVGLLVLGGNPVWRHTAALANPAAPLMRYENGHLLYGEFRAYYEAHGDKASFGLPITSVFLDAGGLTVQYFEYARFEWHDQVRLSHLGRFFAEQHQMEEAFSWREGDEALDEDRLYLADAGHTLGGAFRWYWQQTGGGLRHGLPISEEFYEVQPDGSSRLTQYFERSILIYQPGCEGTSDEVIREPLGLRYAHLYVEPLRLEPEAPLQVLAEASLPFHPTSPDGHNIALAASRLNGVMLLPGERLGFLATIGEVSAANGYVPGSGIENGVIVNTMIGGGICTVSTLLYRAAWYSGLPILERTGHRYWLRAYADQPGLEAAVAVPDLELSLGNDTLGELIIEAEVINQFVRVRIWGRSDGRTVIVAQPEIRTEGRAAAQRAMVPGVASRRFVLPTLGSTEQPAREVINRRTIRGADGKLIRQERVVTRYAALPVRTEPSRTPTPPSPPDEKYQRPRVY
ncbi:MAG: hypothetical protein EOM24_08915 [Chloroflexia bacterium]|nr:hypothetical protein [Chloroflexia bacterium]